MTRKGYGFLGTDYGDISWYGVAEKIDLTEDNASKLQQFSKEWQDITINGAYVMGRQK